MWDGIDRLADWRANRTPRGVIAINRRSVRSPWGGGNQWIDQITRALRASGYSVRFTLDDSVDCVLIVDPRIGPTASFDVQAVERLRARKPRVAVIQRVNDNDKHRGSACRDQVQASANHLADHTVFLSRWLRDYEADRWFDIKRPHAVIWNGADTRYFNPTLSLTLAPGEPMRLVTHHWSKEWNKGFGVYAEIDQLIADGLLQGVELWVIGRWPDAIVWRAARTFPPAREAQLAGLLRQCHVYVTASKWESGGMHFIEGAQCGLPILYHTDGGGIVEVAERFGIGFTDDVRSAIVEMRNRYTELRAEALSRGPSGTRMCAEYGALIQHAIQEKQDRA